MRRIRSNTTFTTINNAVPPIESAATPVTICIPIGRTATILRNTAPTRVRRVTKLPRYSEVCPPGRMPGINAPLRCRFFDTDSGSNVTAV